MSTTKPLISYHRGGVETYEPGTSAAYRAAIEQDAELVEFDVWRSSDGVIFCTHDEYDQSGVKLADLTWPEISTNHPDIPTYEEILKLANGTSICHVDLKQTGYEKELVASTFAQLGDPTKSAWFTSHERSSVQAIREIDDNLMVALSLGRDMAGKSKFETFKVRLSEFVPFLRLIRSKANAVAVNYQLLTRGLKLFCKLSNRKIMVWTVNDDNRIKKYLSDESIDVLITDRPIYSTRLRQQLHL